MIPLTGNAAGYIKVVITIEAQVDTDDFETALNKWQNKNYNEKSNLVEHNKSQQELIERQAKRIKELEQNLANIKTEQDKQNVQQEMKQIDKEALYIQKIDDGWKFWYNKDYNKALETFNEAVQLNPDYYRGYYGCGTAYKDLNNYELAITNFNRSIELNPNDTSAYYSRGVAYAALKNYDAAIADYNKAIELNPNFAATYNNRGIAYKDLKQYKKAIADFTKCIELDSKSMWAYKMRGDCYQELGEIEKANADFAKARELGYKG